MRHDVDDVGLLVQVDHQAQRLAMSAPRRQLVGADGEDAPVRGPDQQLVRRIGGDQEAQLVAFLELQLGGIVDLALGGADPAAIRQDDSDRFARDEGFRRDEGRGVDRLADHGATRRDQGLAYRLQLLTDGLPLLGLGRRQRLQRSKFFRQLLEFLLDRHFFETGQLTQAGVENEVGLKLAQSEGRDQRRLGLLFLADDADDFVQVQEDDAKAFQQVQALLDAGDAPLAAAVQHHAAVIQEGPQALLQTHDARRAGGVQHVHVDGEAHLEIGQLEQAFHQHFRLDGAVLRFEDQADVLRRLVAHVAQQGRLLVLDQVGQGLDQARLLHLVRHLGARRRGPSHRRPESPPGFPPRRRRSGNPVPARSASGRPSSRPAAPAATGRRRSVRPHYAAGSRSPCPRRCPTTRWPAGWGSPPAGPPALRPDRHRWGESRPRPDRCRPAAERRRASACTPYNASQQHYRRRYSRNCPARRQADSALRNPAPDVPEHHRSTHRRAGDSRPSPRRRPWRICARPPAGSAASGAWRT
uniref:LigA n=1 Tax=Parastrongyloides trichosuri TaxID=131310 RepID=A0A0N4ZJN0_PARTI